MSYQFRGGQPHQPVLKANHHRVPQPPPASVATETNIPLGRLGEELGNPREDARSWRLKRKWHYNEISLIEFWATANKCTNKGQGDSPLR